MKLSQRIFKIVSLPFFLSIVVVYIFSSTSILNSFGHIETNNVEQDTQRVINFINKEINNLSMVNYEYSNWTDTYEFMESHDEEYLKVNYFDSTSFRKYRINMVMFVDNSGKVVYSHSIDEGKGLQKSLSEYEQTELVKNTLTAFKSSDKEVKGIVSLDNKMLLVAARPIVKSDESGVPRGFLLFGTIIDQDLVKYFSKEMNFNLTFFKYNEFEENKEELLKRRITVHVKDENFIDGHGMMMDLFQNPALVVHLTKERTIYNQAKSNVRFYTIILAAIGVLFNSSVIVLLDKLVVKKIIKIKNAIDHVNETGDLSQRVIVLGDDEITHLAQDFNSMFENLNESRKEAVKLAYYDTLTGLPNRKKLIETLEKKISDYTERFAIFFVDLDNFKYINDSLGHEVGDVVLEKVAGRLKKFEISGNLVSRVGGDEFVIIQQTIESSADAEKLAVSILKILKPVIKYSGREHYIGASVGISLFPDHGINVSTLMKNADAAMYEAKNNGKHGYRLYSEASNFKTLENFTLENHLRKALNRNEFLIHFQPIFSIANNSIIGCEALTRWIKDGNMIPPSTFIPIAKHIGEIVTIDNWVLLNSCMQCKKWQESFGRNIYISVNVSFKQLQQENFMEQVKEVLDITELEPKYLNFEITEDESMEDVELTIRILKSLKELGVKISLDDFGTGYSSLSYVNKLPLDVIKIDRSLIENIHTENKSLEIIRSIIAMSHSLNTTVIAEGIENEEQLNKLMELDCEAAQGFYLGRPAAPDLFEEKFFNK